MLCAHSTHCICLMLLQYCRHKTNDYNDCNKIQTWLQFITTEQQLTTCLVVSIFLSYFAVQNIILGDSKCTNLKQVGWCNHTPFAAGLCEYLIWNISCGGHWLHHTSCKFVLCLSSKRRSWVSGQPSCCSIGWDTCSCSSTLCKSLVHVACANVIWKNLQNYSLSFCWTLASPQFCKMNLCQCILWGK